MGERGDLVRAEAAFRRADQGGDASGAFNLGLVLEGKGDLARVQAAYHRADARDDGPTEPGAMFSLGLLDYA